MGYDKVVNSVQLDENIKSVADAIRTKGGTTEQITFPTGMIAAINAIQAGGGGGTLPEPDDCVGWYRLLRPKNWPKINLPSEITEDYKMEFLIPINKNAKSSAYTNLNMSLGTKLPPYNNYRMTEKKYLDTLLVSERNIEDGEYLRPYDQNVSFNHNYSTDTENFNFVLLEFYLRPPADQDMTGEVSFTSAVSPIEVSYKNMRYNKKPYLHPRATASKAMFYSIATNINEAFHMPTQCKNLFVIPECPIDGIDTYQIQNRVFGWPDGDTNLLTCPFMDLGNYGQGSRTSPYRESHNLLYIPIIATDDIDVPGGKLLTHKKVQEWIEKVPTITTTKKIYFASRELSLLVDGADIEKLTNKGWTVSVY